MRILHTSDWHLKPKHSFSYIEEGKLWDRICEEKLNTLKRIPKLAEKHNVDFVVIAGDIFDNSNPPEYLKAEVCKILNELKDKSIAVFIVPGRPGGHDYVSDRNFAIMDLMEAYKESVINIYDKSYIKINDMFGIGHLMLSGISDFYKDTVDLNDVMFEGVKTILLGDYHSFYKKTYGRRTFVYSGAPYPTRFGENNHSINLIDLDDDGAISSLKRIQMNTYELVEDSMEYGGSDVPFVLKIKKKILSEQIPKTISELNDYKRKMIKNNKKCIDIIWEIKPLHSQEILTSEEDRKQNLQETCLRYIEESSPNKDECKKLFMELQKAVE